MPRSKKDSTVTNASVNVTEPTNETVKTSKAPKASSKQSSATIATTQVDTTSVSSKSAKTVSKLGNKATKEVSSPKAPEPKVVTVTRLELAGEVAKAVGRMMEITARDAETIVAEIIQSIIDALRSGDEIEIRGFGAFRLRSRRPRNGRNPKTGAAVSVPGKTVCYFKQGKDLKEFLKQQ